MKRRIVITSNNSWFIYNFFCSAITEFMREGDEVCIVASRDKYTERLVDLGCSFFEIPLDRSGANVLNEWNTIKTLYQHLKALSPECVLNFTPKLNIYSAVICKILKIPVINSVAGLGYIVGSQGIKSLVGKVLLRLTQPLANHVIFQNNDDLEYYVERQWVASEKTSRVHGIGVNLTRFLPYNAPNDGTVRFLLFARMLKTKGVFDYVEAAENVALHIGEMNRTRSKKLKVEFSLLGFIDGGNPDGIPQNIIEKWDNESVVRYLGETDNVIEYVRDFDCVVLPSFYREGIPQCLIEAAAMAKPIITTDHVGCRETVIDQVSGYLVPPREPEALSEAMIKMARLTHEQRIAMGKVARRKAENEFCHLNVAKHYKKAMDSILSSKAGNIFIENEV